MSRGEPRRFAAGSNLRALALALAGNQQMTQVEVEIKPEHKRRSSLFRVFGCLVIVAIVVGVIAFGIIELRRQARLSLERSKAQWRQKAFDSVKQGDSSALVMDSKLLPMLATDAQCQKNVTRLDFALTELDAVDSSFVAELPNVTSMSFYCTRGTQPLLIAARTLPITYLYFEMPDLPVESYLLLKEFPHLKKFGLNM